MPLQFNFSLRFQRKVRFTENRVIGKDIILFNYDNEGCIAKPIKQFNFCAQINPPFLQERICALKIFKALSFTSIKAIFQLTSKPKILKFLSP